MYPLTQKDENIYSNENSQLAYTFYCLWNPFPQKFGIAPKKIYKVCFKTGKKSQYVTFNDKCIKEV